MADNWIGLASRPTQFGYRNDAAHLLVAEKQWRKGSRNGDGKQVRVLNIAFENMVWTINSEVINEATSYRITDATTIAIRFGLSALT